MTTYSADMFSLTFNQTNGVNSNFHYHTLEIVMSQPIDWLTYATMAGNPEPNTVDLDLSGVFNLRIDGTDVTSFLLNSAEARIFTVGWGDGKTSVILYLDDPEGDPGEFLEAGMNISIGGDPLPVFANVGDFEDWVETVTSETAFGTGVFSPGSMVPLNGFQNVNVSEHDRITGTNAADLFKSGGGADVVRGLGGNDTLEGQSGNDRLFGGNGKDTLKGGSGVDRLFGNGGNDKLNGDAGDDTLNGGAGKDILKGGADKDTLNGGDGNDKMIGGSGNDRFIFSKGDDRITDFNAANNKEKIDLSGVNSIKSFKDLKNNHTAQDGSDLVITAANGDSLTLEGLAIGDLNKGDFIF